MPSNKNDLVLFAKKLQLKLDCKPKSKLLIHSQNQPPVFFFLEQNEAPPASITHGNNRRAEIIYFHCNKSGQIATNR